MTDLQELPEPDALRDDVDYLLAMLEPELAEGRAAAIAASTPRSTAASLGGFASTSAHVWRNLSRFEAGKAWDELTTWVDWLVDRYQLDDTLPACWYRHGAIVDELDALRAAWNVAYLGPNARLGDPAEWLKILALTLTHIHAWDRYGCAAGTHHEDAAGSVDHRTRNTRTAYLQADLAVRANPALETQQTETAQNLSGSPL
jgi:hypothetical protein